ncbi:MAG: hypothetical protein PWQ67_2288 [Clostridia bacterium]|nr:hypothetical protein [Clostridia bacterium]MDN5323834.1 hypothetical protein [Clostridia bacterium]
MKIKLGMRTLKTGLGIYLAFFISNLMGLEKGALAAITAVVGMQPSLKSSIKTIKNQLLATIIGCIIALFVAYYFQGNLVAVALAAMITIWLCVYLGWQDSIILSVITLILVGEATRGDFFTVAQNRITMIFIGLSVAFALNLLIPPKHTSRLIEKVDELRQTFEIFYHQCIDDILKSVFLSREEVKSRTQKIKNLMEEARAIYVLSIDSKLGYDEYKEKDTYFLFRKSINAIQSNLERLLEIHRSIVLAPNDEAHVEIREIIHDYLTSIFIYHQKIYDHILFGKPLEERIKNEFAEKEKLVETRILTMVNHAQDLGPLHYYNMVAEGQRIMNKAWSLVEDKERFDIQVEKKV